MRVLGTLLGLAAVLSAVKAKLTVHLNCHTHDDVGWLKTVDQYYTGINKQIDSSTVQYILHTVINELEKSPDRKFMYVEQAFFQRYWNQQDPARQDLIRRLVKNRQLEFVNGGWCMHDEASTHWIDMIDQTTLGHRFIMDEFGVTPNVTWQIDPFGHSATQASLLGSNAGFNAFFTARIDYQDFKERKANQATEWIWRASPSFGENSQVFSGIFQWADQHLYGAPDPMNFEMYSTDPPPNNDPRLTDYNMDWYVEQVVSMAYKQAEFNVGEHLLWNLGFDFNHENSHEWYKNIDIVIDAIRKNGSINIQYSTPSIYVAAKNQEALEQGISYPVKTDDGFPYANDAHSYWTGYMSSRPALKRYVRYASHYLQFFRHIELWTKQKSVEQSADDNPTELMWENVAVAQHHDGVSGTSKQHVAFDYAQRIAKGWNEAESALLPLFVEAITDNSYVGFSLATCPLTNVSICDTQSYKQAAIVLYNTLGHTRSELVTLPVSDYSQNWQVVDQTGLSVASAVLPVFKTPATESDSAQYEIAFMASVQPVGFNTYFLLPTSGEKVEQKARNVILTDCSSKPTLSSDSITIHFDESCQVSGWSTKQSSKVIPFTINFAYYEAFQSQNEQNSGAYIFRPANQYSIPIINMSAQLQLIDESIVHEARLTINDWISVVIRLVDGQSNIEVDWTVGPVPIDDGIGKEVIIQYNSTDLAIKSKDEQSVPWYTDSNGREFQQRIRDFRQTWKLANTEPISQNYVPVNAAAYINSTGQNENGDMQSSLFSVIVDRSQGCASQADGSLEFLLHRRLLFDDNRGVGEPMNETSGIINCYGQDNCPWGIQRTGKPLVIRGTHYLRFDQVVNGVNDLGDVRALQNRVYSPLVPLVGELAATVPEYVQAHVISASMLSGDLPKEVELSHLHVWKDGTFLARLAHNFGVGDDNVNVHSVDVDLNKVFPMAKDINELSITANQPASNIQPLKWQTDSKAGTERQVERQAGIRDSSVTIAPAEVRTFTMSF